MSWYVWMQCECFHHWSMHIETHRRLGRSHTRASTIDITLHHSQPIQREYGIAIISYSPPKDGTEPTRQQLCKWGNNCVSLASPRGLDEPVMKGATRITIRQKSKIVAANGVWWVGHLSPKWILVGPTIALIIRINVWAMQLIRLPFPCPNIWIKSRCWRHHIPLRVRTVEINQDVEDTYIPSRVRTVELNQDVEDTSPITLSLLELLHWVWCITQP